MILSSIMAIVFGMLASAVCGVLSGLALGRNKIDTTLAAMMGMFYGTLAGMGAAVAVLFITIMS